MTDRERERSEERSNESAIREKGGGCWVLIKRRAKKEGHSGSAKKEERNDLKDAFLFTVGPLVLVAQCVLCRFCSSSAIGVPTPTRFSISKMEFLSSSQ